MAQAAARLHPHSLQACTQLGSRPEELEQSASHSYLLRLCTTLMMNLCADLQLPIKPPASPTRSRATKVGHAHLSCQTSSSWGCPGQAQT